MQIAFSFSRYLTDNKLFDANASRDRGLERFELLKLRLNENGYRCDTVDQCGSQTVVILFFDIAANLRDVLKTISSNKNIKIIYVPEEPPLISCLNIDDIIVNIPCDKVLSWNDEYLLQDHRAVKCNIGQPVINITDIPNIPFERKKFLTAIYSNKFVEHENSLYAERLRAFEYFAKNKSNFDLYGMGWEDSANPVITSIYRGPIETKKDILKNYKFTLCFENAKNYPGLITEKIFDCFAAGTVPIYYGAPNILDYIPKQCFIDFRNFNNYDELYQSLLGMDNDEYQRYLDAVKDFLKTPNYYEFTSRRYAEVVKEQIQQVINASTPERTVLGYKLALLKVIWSHPWVFIQNFKKCRRFLFDWVTTW